jgi:DNA-binding NarL/FixJ family response regulator
VLTVTEQLPSSINTVLSKREIELAKLLTSGLTNRAAAAKMKISVRTVEAHRARLMKKLGIRSIVELVRLPFDSMKAKPEKNKDKIISLPSKEVIRHC